MAKRLAAVEKGPASGQGPCTGHGHGEGCGHHHGSGDVEAVKLRLREEGVRLTKPRLLLLDALGRLAGPATIEAIHAEVGKDYCDLATVYRNLAGFEQAGVVRKLHFDSGTALYEIEASEREHHHHIICKTCRKVEPVDGCVVAPLEQQAQERGYTGITHVIELFGICPECSQKR